MQHGAVADSETSRGIWRVEDRTNFVDREMSHQPLVMAFTRDGMDLLRLCQRGGNAKFDISDEGFDSSEPPVARSRAITTLFLDVREKVENQCGVDLLDADLGGLDSEPLAGKDEQEPKSMSIGLARMSAATLHNRHVFAQKTSYQRSNRRHIFSPVINASAAAARLVISSGVASSYQ
jgi:hypothetical protein